MDVYDKLETENPLLDEILYNVKLMIKSCILKNDYEADNAETEDSKINGDKYILAYENRCTYIMFDDYDAKDYFNAGVINNSFVDYYLSHPEEIDDNLKNRLLKARVQRFLDEYEELNPYYRNICGLPPVGDNGIFLTPDDCKGISNIDYTLPVHKMSKSIILTLQSKGIIDELIKKYPEKYYLKNIAKFITPYAARRANNYSLIYVEENGIEPVLRTRFKDLIEENRPYFIRTMVDDGYRMYNDYYDRFIIMMIVAQTICDMVNEIPDYYIRRDVFDIRTCEYFLEANGVKFFSDIPLKYQKRMVQDINLLCKYKSTNSNIKQISKIFGQNSIKIYQYYLQKVRKKNSNGDYIFDGDLEDKYDLQFVKVPLDGGEVNDCCKSSNNIVDYDATVSSDKYWSGPYDQKDIKHQILEQDFSIIKSKYLSIDATLSLTELTFQVAYFTNMVLYSNLDLDLVTVNVPSIGPCRIFDIFCYIYALTYLYYGRSDDILYDMSSVLQCRGFNFEADLTELSEYIANKGYTLEDLGVSGFEIPRSGVLSMAQMMNIFINNRNIYDFVQEQMYKSENKDEYDCYKKIYDALFITDINYKSFYIDDLGRNAKTYTEYLEHCNGTLYSSLMEAKKMYLPGSDNEDMKKLIFNKLESATSILSSYSDDLEMVFYDSPTNTLDVTIEYINKVINFFKSFKVTVLGLQDLYYLEKDHIYIIDDINILYIMAKRDHYNIYDDIMYNVLLTKNTTVDIIDHEVIIPHFTIWDKKDLYDHIESTISDKIQRNILLTKKDDINIDDYVHLDIYDPHVWYKLAMEESFNIIKDKIQKTLLMSKKDSVDIDDYIHLNIYDPHVWENLDIDDTFDTIKDKIRKTLYIAKKDIVNISDYAHLDIYDPHIWGDLNMDETVNTITDYITTHTTFFKKDLYEIKDAITMYISHMIYDNITHNDEQYNINDYTTCKSIFTRTDIVNITDNALITEYSNV